MLIKERDLKKVISEAKNKYALISSVSFEARSMGAANELRRLSVDVHYHFIFDYPTIAEPVDEDKKIRNDQRKFFENCFDVKPKQKFVKVSPISLTNIVREMEGIFLECKGCQLFVDISCFSGIHLIAMATAIFKTNIDFTKIHFLYSTPNSYYFDSTARFICRDVIHVPIGKPRHLTHEGHAIGVVFPGHEPERLAIALEELEPSDGMIFLSRTIDRPDFLCSSFQINEYVIKRLRSLYGGDYESTDLVLGKGWKCEVIDLYDASKLSYFVDSLTVQARKSEAPIILYPFGPKVHTLIVALKMAYQNDIDTWAIYPVPNRFHVRSTGGVDKTTCFSVFRKNQDGRISD